MARVLDRRLAVTLMAVGPPVIVSMLSDVHANNLGHKTNHVTYVGEDGLGVATPRTQPCRELVIVL